MPSVKKAAPAKSKPKADKPTPPPAIKPEPPPKLKYPEYRMQLYSADSAAGPITVALIKDWLGWESEPEYAARVAKENPGVKATKVTFGTNFHFVDILGNKIRCRHNGRNRPFDAERSKALAQELLTRVWAGPTCFPGETVNGESFVFSRTGECHNGQKRGAALVFANQMWEQDDHWHELWPTPPVMDSSVVFGVSDREEIVRTIDGGQERSEADMFYTMDVFSKLDPKDRKECSGATQGAVDLVWARTKAASQQWTRYKTNSEAKLFVERHETLLRCIKHCWEENKGDSGRPISINLKLTTGFAAGLMYLMATSNSDGDAYRSAEPRVEAGLDFSLFDKASDFWALVPKGPQYACVTKAITGLVEDHAAREEKVAIVWKAWLAFRDREEIVPENLTLEYAKDGKGEFKLLPNGRKELVEFADFGGIDLPSTSPFAASQSPQDEAAIRNGSKAPPVRTPSKLELELTEIRKEHPDKILVFKSKMGVHRVFNSDCETVRAVLDVPVQDDDGMQFCSVPENRLAHLLAKLLAAGKRVALCERVGDAVKVADQVRAKVKPTKGGKP